MYPRRIIPLGRARHITPPQRWRIVPAQEEESGTINLPVTTAFSQPKICLTPLKKLLPGITVESIYDDPSSETWIRNSLKMAGFQATLHKTEHWMGNLLVISYKKPAKPAQRVPARLSPKLRKALGWL